VGRGGGRERGGWCMTGKVGKQKERKRKEGGKGCVDAIV